MNDIRAAANGRWHQILTGLGADPQALDGKNRPCPACGGDDRFFFDDDGGRGTHGCRHCGAGDGFELVKKMLGYSQFPDVAKAVGGVIGFDGKSPSKEDQAAYQRKVAARCEQAERERAERHRLAALVAQAEWKAGTSASDNHPYLKAKGVLAYGLLQSGDDLLIPVRIGGEISSVQRITPDGGKTFTTGSKVGGGYHSIAGADDCSSAVVYIAEGYATGVTIRVATGCRVAVAFNAGNLTKVAAAICAKLPDAVIVIAGDNDVSKTGERDGKDAANAVGGIFIMPPDVGCDWNDHAAAHGLDAVRVLLTSQVNEIPKQVQESAPETAAVDADIQPPIDDKSCVRIEPKNCKGVGDESHTKLVYKVIEPFESMVESMEGKAESYDEVVERLAGMKPHEYDQVRKATAKAFEVRTVTLDDAVNAIRKREQSAQAFFADIEPWEDPVNGKALVSEIMATLRRFVFLPKYADMALALWTVNTFAHDANYFSPMVVLTSPEKRCGKSTTLAILSALCHWSLSAGNVSPAVVFRAIELWHPTLMIDEVDTFLAQDESLAGVINSGHSKGGARVLRCEGDANEPKAFSTWCPKVLAGIGRIRGTLEDRSIIIQLCRKLDGEKVERLRLDRGGFGDIQRKCQRWADDNFDAVRDADPSTPPSLHDRAADNWMPLLAIADLCGIGEQARVAALMLSGCEESESVDVMLLRDIRGIFERAQTDRLSSQAMVDHLVTLEDRPWSEWTRGRPMTTNKLAGRLKAFGIHPKTMRMHGDGMLKGYDLKAFRNSFLRYIPDSKRNTVTSEENQSVTEISKRNISEDVTLSKTLEPLGHNDCYGVTLQKVTSDGEGKSYGLGCDSSEVEDVIMHPDLIQDEVAF